MYIKITNEKHEYYGQYFEVSFTSTETFQHVINIIGNKIYQIIFNFCDCEEVIKNHEQKRAYWKWKRFKTTYLMHKSIEGSELTIDKFETPNIEYKECSFCFFNDSKKWGIFKDDKKIKLLNSEELQQWLTTI
jgi:hypothetical protein